MNEAKYLNDLMVEEFTSPQPLSINLETNIQDAEKIMKKEGIRHLLVLDKDRVIGTLSEKHINLAYRFKNTDQTPVKKVMEKRPYIVKSKTKIAEVAHFMSENKQDSAVVISEDGTFGIFTLTDVLNALIEVVRGDLYRNNLTYKNLKILK